MFWSNRRQNSLVTSSMSGRPNATYPPPPFYRLSLTETKRTFRANVFDVSSWPKADIWQLGTSSPDASLSHGATAISTRSGCRSSAARHRARCRSPPCRTIYATRSADGSSNVSAAAPPVVTGRRRSRRADARDASGAVNSPHPSVCQNGRGGPSAAGIRRSRSVRRRCRAAPRNSAAASPAAPAP